MNENTEPWGNATVRAIHVDGGKNVSVRCVCSKGVDVHEQQFSPHPEDIVLDDDRRPTDNWIKEVKHHVPGPGSSQEFWSWWLDGPSDEQFAEGRASTEAAANQAMEAVRRFWDEELSRSPAGFPGVDVADGH